MKPKLTPLGVSIYCVINSLFFVIMVYFMAEMNAKLARVSFKAYCIFNTLFTLYLAIYIFVTSMQEDKGTKNQDGTDKIP